MNDLEKAARLALGALKQIDEAMPFPVAKFAQAALRQALSNNVEQPAQQEPIGYTTGINWQPRQSEMVVKIVRNKQPEHGFVHAIYTSSQRKPWVGLTEGEIENIWEGSTVPILRKEYINLARAIEAKLKEKNA